MSGRGDPVELSRAAFATVVDAVSQIQISKETQGLERESTSLIRPEYQTSQSHFLEANFELAMEEHERALRLDPRCAESLVLCGQSLMIQARFFRDSEELLRKSSGLFQNALQNGQGMEKYRILQMWGRALLDLSSYENGWRQSALIMDAIAKFEQGYECKPDRQNWINPITAEWDAALKALHHVHQEWR